jgi:predicted DNA-binding transcriptional regulator YafY
VSAPLPELARLLALVPYLREHSGDRIADVARVFGVSEERLRKDLDLLWVCGLPGHGPGDLIDLEFEGETVTLLDEPLAVPEHAESKDLSQGLFQPSAQDHSVVLALHPGAHWVADYHPCESVEDVGDGTLSVTLRTPDLAWVRRLALRLGGTASVVSPPELAEQVRAAAREALAAYA